MLGLKDLAAIAAEHTADLDAEVRPFDIAGQVVFPSTQPAIMGVINLSADSWYRQSICTSVEAAVERGSELQAQGAAIIDIGAESTLRQAQRVSADEQRQRLLPVIEQLASRGVIVSAETYNAGVARACLKGFVDPGLGFYYGNLQDSSMRIRHQMKTFLNAFRLRRLGWPVCNALPHAVECFGDEVRSAEPFFSVIAALGGTDLFRTHEVPRVHAMLRTLGVY